MLSRSFTRETAPRVPSYRRHKPTGQAVVTLNGHDVYLGEHGTQASRAEYDRLIGEWLAAGRCLPRPDSDLTVAELALHYWQFATRYYVKNGHRSTFLSTIRLALRHLRQVYGPTLACDFGPLALQAMQDRFVRAGHSREYVNKLCAVIRRGFKWGVSQELVPSAVCQALAAVPGLHKGRTAAREPEPVQPVAEAVVEATLPFLPAVVADMVRIQRLAGCRPGEVCSMRPCDVDRANEEREKEGQEKLPYWSPNQLRHSAATEIRRRFGLEAAQTVLGHAKADVTQVCAERDMSLAAEVMRRIG